MTQLPNSTFRKKLKRLVVVLGLAALVLAGVLIGRATMMQSQQIEAAAIKTFAIDQDAAAARLAKAVQFKTISYPIPALFEKAEFIGLRDYLAATYPKAHAAMEREIVNDYSLLFKWPGSDPSLKPVLLMGHLDVVPVEPNTETEWEQDPFAGIVSEGFIWGRGTLDDKVNVLGLLEAAERLIEEGFSPKRTIYFSFGHDEELGGSNAAMKTAELMKERGIEFEFVLDEGMAIVENVVPGVSAPVALIGIAEKGYVTLELTVETEGGHSSQPPRETAIGILSSAIHRIEADPFPASIDGPIGDMFEAVAPEMPFGFRILFANLWLFEPVVRSQLAAAPATNAAIRTTTAVTMIEGGVKDNVLPSAARALVNFRIMPGETCESVEARVRSVIADDRVKVAQRRGAVNPSPVSPAEGPAFETIERTIREIFPESIVAPALVLGGTDSRYFTEVSDCVYRFMPVKLTSEDLARIHGKDERLGVAAFADCIRFYKRLIENAAAAETRSGGE